jgi:hypothetical protein
MFQPFFCVLLVSRAFFCFDHCQTQPNIEKNNGLCYIFKEELKNASKNK